jgi:polyhydroxyalkanoate synthase
VIFARPKNAARLGRLAVDRAILRFVHGLSMVMDGGMTPIGNTPRRQILKDGKLEVYRYEPARREEHVEIGREEFHIRENRFPVPILLVPPLMVQPYIYDLRPEHSMVRALRAAGYDVYLVDFGIPGREDQGIRLDHYVLEFMPKAVQAVRKEHGGAPITIAGYCMGGIFALLYTAAWQDRDVRNLVTIASPIDFGKMGLLTFMARLANGRVQALADRIGNIPGRLNSEALKLLAPVKRFTRYADLFVNLWNEEYVKGFDAMSKWSNDFIPYPKEAFKQFMGEMMIENRMMEGLRFGDRVADLKWIRAPVLAFAGESDEIATPASARAILAATSSADVEYVLVPGGHIGVVVGGRAREAVWGRMIDWLRPRSLKDPAPATSSGSSGSPGSGDAPPAARA